MPVTSQVSAARRAENPPEDDKPVTTKSAVVDRQLEFRRLRIAVTTRLPSTL